MPALVNISVGSLRGTSGLEATSWWPFRSKYERKLDRISFTLLIDGSLHNKRRGMRPAADNRKGVLSRGLRLCPAGAAGEAAKTAGAPVARRPKPISVLLTPR